MSLINDALKKAARQRAQEEADLTPLMPGGGGQAAQGGRRMNTQALVAVGAAVVVLIIASSVLTGVFMNGRPAASTPAAKPAPAEMVPQALPKIFIPAPAVSLPKPAPAVVVAPVAEARPQPTATPTAAPIVIAAAPVVSRPVAELPAPARVPAPADQSHSDLVQALVDKLLISGVRTAGAGSKALVDGHVYRLNDVLDRSTGLRLVKVDVDHLTFVDSEGVTYLKSF